MMRGAYQEDVASAMRLYMLPCAESCICESPVRAWPEEMLWGKGMQLARIPQPKFTSLRQLSKSHSSLPDLFLLNALQSCLQHEALTTRTPAVSPWHRCPVPSERRHDPWLAGDRSSHSPSKPCGRVFPSWSHRVGVVVGTDAALACHVLADRG
jgi:hypothetical protein